VLEPVARDETHAVIRWLMGDARKLVDPSEFLQALADQLRAAALDVSRITTGVPILQAFPPNRSACFRSKGSAPNRKYSCRPGGQIDRPKLDRPRLDRPRPDRPRPDRPRLATAMVEADASEADVFETSAF
jgi:hypothetical protein